MTPPFRAALAVVLILVSGLIASCGGDAGVKAPRRPPQKVFIIGFDGMDPTLARKWMDEGRLPNLKQLADEGVFTTLASTQPSESPTAWSSFATGVNPGGHNVYDFLIRHVDSYTPDFNMIRKEPPQFLWGFLPIKRPKIESTRGGTSFWVTAGRDGIRTTVMTVPVTFPPETIGNGQMLSGLPTPDLKATLGTYFYFGTDVSRYEEGDSEFAGRFTRLVFEGDTAKTTLAGPPNPIVRQSLAKLQEKPVTDATRTAIAELEAKKDVEVPLSIHWDRAAKSATIEIGGQTISLHEREWSTWVPLSFSINWLVGVKGMMQFFLADAGSELHLYGSPINMDPRDPPLPISTPSDLAPELVSQVGAYRTLGWAESSDKPLNENRLDEFAFLDDSYRAMADREKLILNRLQRDDWDLFVGAIETTDRISHMMWRLIDPTHPMYDAALAAKYGDSIQKVYERADRFIGQLRSKLPADTVFIVMSDHGFHSFRRSVNLNTWLVENGYMSFQGQSKKKTLADLFGRGTYFEGVDWTKTKAYAVGLGQIYFNLRGREGKGIVSPGAEYTQLQNEIRSKLLTLTDPKDGARVFRDIYKRDDIYHGEFLGNAPDLEVGFNDGFRVGWQDTLGGIAQAVVEDNNRKWSGDHCATATEISGGVLFVNRKITTDKPSIMDLAPSVLKLLGVAIPTGLDGKPIF